MKKLPKIYHEDINKKIKNNKEVTYIKNSNTNTNSVNVGVQEESVDEVLKKVFSGIGYSFNIPLRIETTSKVYETSLIGKSRDYLITFDNDTIPLSEVKRIIML